MSDLKAILILQIADFLPSFFVILGTSCLSHLGFKLIDFRERKRYIGKSTGG